MIALASLDLGVSLQAPGAEEVVDASLARFTRADWGNISHDGRLANEDALAMGEGLVCAFYPVEGSRGIEVLYDVEERCASVDLADYHDDPDQGPEEE